MPGQSVEVSDVTVAEESKTKSKVKDMLITFFDVRGYNEFLPLGQMINRQVYKEILQRMLRSVCEKR